MGMDQCIERFQCGRILKNPSSQFRPIDPAALCRHYSFAKARHDAIIGGRPCTQLVMRQTIRVISADELSRFRYRGEGWPGTAHMETHDGREFDLSYEQAWLDDYVPWKYDLQFRCKICPDAIGETADVSCPDGWIMKHGKPVYEEAPGANLIITRTQAGEDLVREAAAEAVLSLEAFSIAQLDEMHDDHKNRKTHWPARILGLRLAGQPAIRISGYRLLSAILAAGLPYSWKSFWGTFQRARKGLNREPGFPE